jgi:hypothetical protein
MMVELQEALVDLQQRVDMLVVGVLVVITLMVLVVVVVVPQ